MRCGRLWLGESLGRMCCRGHRLTHERRLLSAPVQRSHGPVWRTMLLVDRERSAQPGSKAAGGAAYGYSLHWPSSGESACFGWHDMPAALLAMGSSGSGTSCSSGSSGDAPGEQPLLSGPLWLGPLHSLGHLQHVQAEADARGWLQADAAGSRSGGLGSGEPALPATRKGGVGSLQHLLGLILEEAEAEEAAAGRPQAGDAQAAAGVQQPQQGLPPWYLRMNDVGRAGALTGPPSRDALAEELRRRWAS